ncbi:hemagglutinin [Salinivibrio kushneri]|uniref:Neutral metalloproteinase n=1 Tax=Salinivibrio kushneri TaxID=1908198 RepID=A0AB36JVQ6_9GAMM|nr:M4 family metallopeptidase [Salinivibrio kushneri]OOE39190.1 hemagglutinin [Salinivibrio kushneri]QCP01914.1 peptidase M4 family protein [Salinivibrio kushneri]
MRKTLLALTLPLAIPAQAANVVDASSLDLSAALNDDQPRAMVGSSPALSFREKSRLQVGNKALVRKQQLHHGVPVYGYSVVENTAARGFAPSVKGDVVTDIEQDIGGTLPMINQQQAIAIAQGQTHQGSQHFHQDDANTELLVWLDKQQTARLVYKVDYLASDDGHPSRPIKIIDAKSGDILDSWDGIAHLEAGGPGGNQKSGRFNFGPSTQLGGFQVNSRCQMDSPDVKTINMNNREWGGEVHQFNCPQNTYRQVNGAYAPMNDAQFFGQKVFDMYQDWLGIRPIRQKLTMRVHYGQGYGNAFWDGRQMTFGDGNRSMYPLTTWDVIAHEVSHGFTEQNSGLEYRGMSGGMNESFSDVAAAALGQYVFGEFNWKMGEDVMKHSEAMRYFINPSKDGRSIGHVDRYYQGIDVHLSSGIYNKAFYHLATSDQWNIKKAFKAFATANQLYWRPNSSFQQGANGVCEAAKDLNYPAGAVSQAFAEVGIQPQGCQGTEGNPKPDPEPQPEPEILPLTLDQPVQIQGRAGAGYQFVVKNAPRGTVWLQTYRGHGEVDLYAAVGRPATVNDNDCASTNAGNEEYCGFSQIQGMDLYVTVVGARDYATNVLARLDDRGVETNRCTNMPTWGGYNYYPAGVTVQYQGHLFQATQDNWGIDPFTNQWVWQYQGSCQS